MHRTVLIKHHIRKQSKIRSQQLDFTSSVFYLQYQVLYLVSYGTVISHTNLVMIRSSRSSTFENGRIWKDQEWDVLTYVRMIVVLRKVKNKMPFFFVQFSFSFSFFSAYFLQFLIIRNYFYFIFGDKISLNFSNHFIL